MRAVAILRQHFPTDVKTLEELAAIADRLEEIAKSVDWPKSTRSVTGTTISDRRDWARGPPPESLLPTAC
jgi:hypothetical protein